MNEGHRVVEAGGPDGQQFQSITLRCRCVTLRSQLGVGLAWSSWAGETVLAEAQWGQEVRGLWRWRFSWVKVVMSDWWWVRVLLCSVWGWVAGRGLLLLWVSGES